MAADHIVVAGEVSANDITVETTTGTLTNNGFLLADGNLTIVAGENVKQQRAIATEYDIYFDPALQQYLEAYQTQLLKGGPEADLASEMLARAGAHEILNQYVNAGASMSATNVDAPDHTSHFCW